MASKSADDFTVVDLKELLKSYGLSTAGNKAELVLRLDNHDPSGQWTNKVVESAKTRKDVAPAVITAGNETALGVDELSHNRREIDLLRREKALMERELEIARRELESARSGRSSSVSGQEQSLVQNKNARISVRTIADLLGYFDGKSEDFLAWSKQVRVLQATYRLDDDEAKILIGMRIQDKAREWMQSRPEFIEMSVDELLRKFEHMFYHRPSKIIVRQQFQDRRWKRDEPFENYFHDKVIKANRVPIDDEDELIDHLVEGIPDQTLRNQAKMQCFDTPESLLRAFETLRLPSTSAGEHGRWREQKIVTRVNHREDQRFDGNAPRKTSTMCFSCGGLNHISKYCPTKERGPKCFRCTEYGHISSACPKRTETYVKETNFVAQSHVRKLCKMVRLNNCNIVALVDTGSDLTLMRAERYIKIGAPRLEDNETMFKGIGSKSNETLGKFVTNISIDGSSYSITIHVVSDCLLQYDMLLGADFLNNVNLTVNKGTILINDVNEELAVNSNIPEIYRVECIENCKDAALRQDVCKTIADYVPRKTRDVDVKMNIILKDDEPIYQRARRLAPVEKNIVDAQIDEWLHDDVIQPSLLEYTSPIVLVKKKDAIREKKEEEKEMRQKEREKDEVREKEENVMREESEMRGMESKESEMREDEEESEIREDEEEEDEMREKKAAENVTREKKEEETELRKKEIVPLESDQKKPGINLCETELGTIDPTDSSTSTSKKRTVRAKDKGDERHSILVKTLKSESERAYSGRKRKPNKKYFESAMNVRDTGQKIVIIMMKK